MNRDYTYFCPGAHDEYTTTRSWDLDEFDKNKDNVICPICGKTMQIDISPRKIKDNSAIGNRSSLDPKLNYAKAANGRDGRSFF